MNSMGFGPAFVKRARGAAGVHLVRNLQGHVVSWTESAGPGARTKSEWSSWAHSTENAMCSDTPAFAHLPVASSELELKALARFDRAEALDQLVRRYGEKLYLHAWYILHDAAEARDVAQEVFIRALREPRLFEPEFRIQAWLYRVTRNLCFNLTRDRRRRDRILSGRLPTEAPRVDPLDRVFDGERQGELLAAVDLLSADHRDILLLRYYEDLSYAEIADRLGIKLGTVMSRLSRARGRLEEVLGGASSLLAAS